MKRRVELAAPPRDTHAWGRHADPGPGPRLLAASPAPGRVAVLDESDLDWIGEAIELLAQHLGRPWRVVLEAFDALPSSRRPITAVRRALARITAGGGALPAMARRVRAAALGAPALSNTERTARIAAASAALGIGAPDVESLLFGDLRGERPIAFPRGRPSELEVAAAANVLLIQGGLRRADRLHLTLYDDDGTVLRAAVARGLLVTASRASADAPIVLDLVGPLALFQRTAVYGRALGQLVPLLSSAAHWELVLEGPAGRRGLASPVLLPCAPIDRAGTARSRKLARDLERLDADLGVVVGPAPITVGAALLCPDLAIDRRGVRRFIELVGFWTTESLRTKLARYADAGVDVLLWIDGARCCGKDDAICDPRIVLYDRSPDPAELLVRYGG
ncbi:MAG: DUF790 family protein [Kofleriaceae bacterium]